MLQQPARPSGNVQLPYTTADMAERLAKKKAAKDRQDIIDSLQGGLSYGKGGVDLGSVAKSVGGFLKTAYENMPESIDTPVSSYGTGKSLITEPARLAVRRAVGDITAIPKVGEPSPSYSANKIRQQGVALGLLGAAMDYSQFIPVVAKGAGFASDAINASRIARINRSPFPTVKTPGSVIDVDALQGSRLPARIVDTPASPATRLAEAQTQRALPPVTDVSPEITNVTSLTAFRTKTNRNDPRWQTKDQYGFLQDESFKPITTANDQVEYDGVFRTFDPPGMKELLDELNFKPYNKEGALSYNYNGVIPLFNDQLFLKINRDYYNGMGNFIDVYEQPPLWNFVNEDQLKYLGQAYGSETTRQLQRIFATAAPDTPITPATRLAEAQTQRALPPAQVAPTEVAPTTSRLTPPAFRERQVPTSSRLTVETIGSKDFNGTPLPNGRQEIIIRSFNQQTGKYTGALTMSYDPYTKKAIVVGMGANNPMVTLQLISAAATEIRKLTGDVQYPLVPSRSLSAYSRPFVERLQQAGLIDPDYQLPAIESINDMTKLQGPEQFAGPNGSNQLVLDPLSYQPTYNNVLKALVESKRRAKLEGEYGKLATSSTELEKLKYQPLGLNDAAAYRANMQQYGFPEHPLLKQMSDDEFNSFIGKIAFTPRSAAQELIDMWEKIKPTEEFGVFANSYTNTLENLKKFPDLLRDSYLINNASRQRFLSELENILLKLPEDEIFS